MKSVIVGSANGQCKLGYCYDHGIGTKKNEIKAFEWYSKSAENGFALAQNNLENESKKFEFYTKSANEGCALGQCNLGFCYDFGIGTVTNKTNAFEWYLKSAEDVHKAIYYYKKALDNGIEGAKVELARILALI
ncbi:hypothetical protein RclHR1_08950009 [Rhizophagus clarus]|uniref:Uncharacterized protein n=1 Tax=Rhizophagus clarus TaxID=94130 RepID=A0A2Z6S4W7_9GLOM|nr:hypothetical protein RclHR1_08950009 [Rhizophagus clarus]